MELIFRTLDLSYARILFFIEPYATLFDKLSTLFERIKTSCLFLIYYLCYILEQTVLCKLTR